MRRELRACYVISPSQPAIPSSNTTTHYKLPQSPSLRIFFSVQSQSDCTTLKLNPIYSLATMAARRIGLYGGLTAAGGIGYYLYQAGGNPKLAEKEFERALSSSSLSETGCD